VHKKKCPGLFLKSRRLEKGRPKIIIAALIHSRFAARREYDNLDRQTTAMGHMARLLHPLVIYF
jgi:hypothetical protein